MTMSSKVDKKDKAGNSGMSDKSYVVGLNGTILCSLEKFKEKIIGSYEERGTNIRVQDYFKLWDRLRKGTGET